jgi:hypothetical protein
MIKRLHHEVKNPGSPEFFRSDSSSVLITDPKSRERIPVLQTACDLGKMRCTTSNHKDLH